MTSPLRRAAILAIGSELLTPSRTDTNSLFITNALNAVGVEVVLKAIVGDDRAELAELFAYARARADLVVLTGGLGPTADDLTREVVAEQLGLVLSEDLEITESIRRRFEGRGWKMPENNRRQAMVPHGATVIRNGQGTAPGLWIEYAGKGVLLVPGPPREMKPMIEQIVAERLRPRAGGALLVRKVLRIAGRSESRVEELVQPIYSRWRDAALPIDTTILSTPGQIELHFSARGTDAAALANALERASDEVEAVLQGDVFSRDGQSMEQIVGGLLRARNWRIALAESCTGGLATARLTDVSGSSEYVDRTAVTYSNEAKIEMLGVAPDLITSYGAVSEPVAQAMAEGIRDRAEVEVAVGITGIAGPTGGTEAKPVGTVCIAVVAPDITTVRTFRFPGDRPLVKTFAAQTALDMVRRILLGGAPHADWTTGATRSA